MKRLFLTITLIATLAIKSAALESAAVDIAPLNLEHISQFKKQLQESCAQEPRLLQTEKTLKSLVDGASPVQSLEIIHETLSITHKIHITDPINQPLEREAAIQKIMKLGFKFPKTARLMLLIGETVLYGQEVAAKCASDHEQGSQQKKVDEKKRIQEQRMSFRSKIREIKTPSPKPLGEKHVHYDESKHFIPIPALSKSPEALSPEPVEAKS